MGGPKALMSVAGEPWWRVQSRRLAEAGIEATWVVSPAVLRVLCDQTGAPSSLVAADPDAPMFASVIAGVQALADTRPNGLFVLPVDTPAPARRVWSVLLGSDRPRVPAWRGRSGHPVFLPWSIAEELVRLAANQGHAADAPRLDHVIGPTAEVIEVDDPTVCMNLNTPSDIDQYLTSLRRAE